MRQKFEPDYTPILVDEVGNDYYTELVAKLSDNAFQGVKLDLPETGVPVIHCAVPIDLSVEYRVK